MDIQDEKVKLIEWLSSIKDRGIIETLTIIKNNITDRSDWRESFLKQKRNQLIVDLKIWKKVSLSHIPKLGNSMACKDQEDYADIRLNHLSLYH